MRILVDFDNTIAKSSQCIFEIYCEETNDYSKEYTNKHGWDFENLIPLDYKDRAVSLFDKEIFFNRLTPVEYVCDVLHRLSYKHEIIVVTKANPESVVFKSKWIKSYLPFIKNVVYLEQTNFNKGMVQGDIIIDDKLECLLSGDWGYRIVFGEYGWNQDLSGNPQCYFIRHTNWLDIEQFINNIANCEKGCL